MQVLREQVVALVGGALLAALPGGFLAGDAGRLLTTFLGLLTASILPTISLLVGSMSSSGRSVKGINELHEEFQRAITELWIVFWLVAMALIGLLCATVRFEVLSPAFSWHVLTFDPAKALHNLHGTGQFIVGYCSAQALMHFANVPMLLKRALSIRHQIAVDEARRKIAEKVPTPVQIRASFASPAGFGEVREVKPAVMESKAN